jgi:hypothetical protein
MTSRRQANGNVASPNRAKRQPAEPTAQIVLGRNCAPGSTGARSLSGPGEGGADPVVGGKPRAPGLRAVEAALEPEVAALRCSQIDIARRLTHAIWHMLSRKEEFAPRGAAFRLAA